MNSQLIRLVFTGFLKNRRKTKDRKKKSKDGDPDNEQKDIGSDGEERGRSETPTPEHNEEEGVRNPPRDANDPWADFNQPPKKSFYSSSDSDSDDEEVKKIRVSIRPVAPGASGRSATSASVDELQRAVVGLDLNASTLPVSFLVYGQNGSNAHSTVQTKGRSKSVMKDRIMKEAIGTGSQTLKLKVDVVCLFEKKH